MVGGTAEIVRRGRIGKSREMFRLVFFKKIDDRRGRKGGNRGGIEVWKI